MTRAPLHPSAPRSADPMDAATPGTYPAIGWPDHASEAPAPTITATRRPCDALGVCQRRAQPCGGGANAHPAHHHLHCVHVHVPLPPDPSAATHAHTHACRANQCRQGRAPCPVPQACELPDAPGPGATTTTTSGKGLLPGFPGLYDEPATPLETIGACAVVVGLALFAVWAIVWAAGA